MDTMATPSSTIAFSSTVTTKIPPIDSREKLLASIRGCSVVIPDFQQLMHHYPFKVHAEADKLNDDVERALELLVTLLHY